MEKRFFELAELCITNKEYNIAIEAYQYQINKGEQSTYYLKSKDWSVECKIFKNYLFHCNQ